MRTNSVQKWVITRQSYYYSNINVVEIASGGLDYANADALCKKYSGEFQEFTNPIEAADTAIEILRQWRKDCPGKKISIAHGNSMGMGMEFEPSTIKEVKEWAQKEYDSIEKCAECGEILSDERYGSHDFGEYDCCSEYCAEKRYYSNQEEVEA